MIACAYLRTGSCSSLGCPQRHFARQVCTLKPFLLTSHQSPTSSGLCAWGIGIPRVGGLTERKVVKLEIRYSGFGTALVANAYDVWEHCCSHAMRGANGTVEWYFPSLKLGLGLRKWQNCGARCLEALLDFPLDGQC